jgi:DNA-binding transcriptional regulator YiaG
VSISAPSVSVPLALAEIRALCASGDARSIRDRADLSLREMAAHLGVSIATLSCWERAAQRPTGDRALRYRQLLLELDGRPAYKLARLEVRQ